MGMPVWRELGRAEDLDLDFEHASRASTVSRLLAQRGMDSDEAMGEAWAWRLTLGYRIGAVATIVEATLNTATLDIVLECAAESCRAPFQVALPLAALRDLGDAAQRQPIFDVTIEGRAPVRVHRPTGDDVRRWQAHDYASVEAAESIVLESLVDMLAPPLADTEITALSSAIEEADPLPSFAVNCTCPECGAAWSYDVDLEKVLCARLAQQQRELIAEVHALAASYGWSEPEVLRLPPWRRRAYLERIGTGPA